jgi:uncharacterized protein (TIGR02271 family)
MAKTVIGLYDQFAAAQKVVADLHSSGFGRDDISILANNIAGDLATLTSQDANFRDLEEHTLPGIGSVMARGPLIHRFSDIDRNRGFIDTEGGYTGTRTSYEATDTGYTDPEVSYTGSSMMGSLVRMLNEVGVPDNDARFYAEGVRRGGTLVVVATSDEMAPRAEEIMERHNAIEPGERMRHWQERGWTGYTEEAQPYTIAELEQERTSIPIIEERVDVGKRQVQKGGVRVHTHLEERPVEKDVTLRDEQVRVERRPVDRPASGADLDRFRDETIEVQETDEEAFITKEARVVEEVVIDKDVDERTETVRSTARRTDVDTENIGAGNIGTGARATMRDFDTFETDFRNHYNTAFTSSSYTYEQFRPAYRYGYDLANSDRYRNMDWSQVEPDARRQWELTNPNTRWNDFKEAVYAGWNAIRR